MELDTITKLLKDEEGFESKPYLDTVGVPTFGYGFTYITKEEANLIIYERVRDIQFNLIRTYYWYRHLTQARKNVIISMVYQLGAVGFDKFKNAIEAIENEDWGKAGAEMKDSKAYTQTPNRWDRQIKMFIKG